MRAAKWPYILRVCCNPIYGDHLLRLYKRDIARAYHSLKLRLDNILHARSAGDVVRLRPQIPRIARMAAELQANDVIFLVACELFVAVPIFGNLLPFEIVRVACGRPNGLGPAGFADSSFYVGLRHVWVSQPGITKRVWQSATVGYSRRQPNEQNAKYQRNLSHGPPPIIKRGVEFRPTTTPRHWRAAARQTIVPYGS